MTTKTDEAVYNRVQRTIRSVHTVRDHESESERKSALVGITCLVSSVFVCMRLVKANERQRVKICFSF